MVEKNGTAPANARVDVDYSGKTPKIKFDYPKNGKSPEQQAFGQNLFGLHTFIIFFIMVVLMYSPSFFPIKTIDYPKDCNVTLEEYSEKTYNKAYNIYNKYVTGANFTCDNKTYIVDFNRETIIGEKYIGFVNGEKHLKFSIYYLIYILLVVIVGILIMIFLTKYLIKQKWYQKWLPEHNANGFLGRNKKYIKFTKKDVENNMVEIPLFGNVELDYKANGDFSDKLERIKIREHQYNKYKKGKVGKKVIREYKWYARFYFKDKPKDGYLEVIFQ